MKLKLRQHVATYTNAHDTFSTSAQSDLDNTTTEPNNSHYFFTASFTAFESKSVRPSALRSPNC